MFYRVDNSGCGFIATLIGIAILIAVLVSPVTWVVVAGLILYSVIKRALYRRENPYDTTEYTEGYEDSQAGYTERENVNPYSYREPARVPETTPFTEDEFETNAMDVDVEVEDY